MFVFSPLECICSFLKSINFSFCIQSNSQWIYIFITYWNIFRDVENNVLFPKWITHMSEITLVIFQLGVQCCMQHHPNKLQLYEIYTIAKLKRHKSTFLGLHYITTARYVHYNTLLQCCPKALKLNL